MDVLLLGPDGLDPVLVDRWKGDLPTLRRLTREGTAGLLRSSHPPLTAPAWPTMFTGKQGGKHGTFGFTRPEPGSYEQRAINYSEVRAESFWESLDAQGYSCGIVNVPITYPPSDLENGFVISGWPVPRTAEVASDPAVLDRLERDMGEPYRVNPLPPVAEYTHLDNETLYEDIAAGLDHHARAFRHLLETHGDSLDVFFAVFNATDAAGHAFAWEKEYMKRIYVRLDEIIEELLSIVGDDVDVILMSDHGHGVKGEWQFNTNEWLRENGYLTRSDTATATSFLERIGLTVDNLIRLQNRIGLRNAHEHLPDFLYEWFRNTIPKNAEEFSPQNIAWEQTQAYSPQQNTIYVNTHDKPEGSVDEENYATVVESLRSDLEQIPHPDPEVDEPLISELNDKAEIFDGPYDDEAPDMVFIADEMRCSASVGFGDEVFSPLRWGEHRKHGILVTRGPSFGDSETEFEDDIKDVFPLVMALLEASIPRGIDGELPTDRLRVDPELTYMEESDRVESSSRYTAKEAESVEEQLRGLGYLE